MTDITIPDAAVEAAAQASYNHLRAEDDGAILTPWEGYHDKEWWRAFIRVELAAAAPYIVPQALRDAADEVRGYAYTPDDVREVAHGDDYADGITDAHHVFDRLLDARAARIEEEAHG